MINDSCGHDWRRVASLRLVVTVVAALWSTTWVEAGLVLTWQEPVAAHCDDPASGADGSPGAVEEPVADQNLDPQQMPFPGLIQSLRGLAHSDGGASSPPSSPGFNGGQIVAIGRDAPPVALPICSFWYLRERIVQLPSPPLGELLDPPKSSA